MKAIKTIVENISEEVEDAEKYAELALTCEDTRLADTYHTLAKEELNHADRLHEQAVRIIQSYTGTVPEAMKAVWDWEHEKYIEHVAEVKAMVDMYKT